MMRRCPRLCFSRSQGWAQAAILALCALAACAGEEPSASPTPSVARLFAEPPTFAPASPVPLLTPVPGAALPREVAGVSLGMTQPEVERVLGALSCNQRPAGYLLCTAAKDPSDEIRDLEVYFYHGAAMSLTHATPVPDDARSYLDSLVTRYGAPSLNGLRDKDIHGRVHEIYGWKDERTIYSVRFVWVEEAPEPRRLSGLVIALWDRDAYFKWEQDPARLQTPSVVPTATGESRPVAPTPELHRASLNLPDSRR